MSKSWRSTACCWTEFWRLSSFGWQAILSEGRVVAELCFFGPTEDTSHAHIRNKTDHLHTAKETFWTLTSVTAISGRTANNRNVKKMFIERMRGFICFISVSKAKIKNDYYCWLQRNYARCKNTPWLNCHMDSNARLVEYLTLKLRWATMKPPLKSSEATH